MDIPEKNSDEPALTLGEWLKQIDALREQLDAKYGPNHFPSAADIIEEIREERSNELAGNYQSGESK